MAYDEKLADRIRELLEERPDVIEKNVRRSRVPDSGPHGHLCQWPGRRLVRVDPEATSSFVARGAAEVAVMRGRPMAGWLRVSSENLRTKRQLERWVQRAITSVEALPPKEAVRRR